MLTTIHDRVDTVVSQVENVAAVAAGVSVLVVMVLVTADAILRHLFSAPLTFQYHLTKYYLLVSLTMLGLSWGYRTGGAIQIKLLTASLPERVVAPMIRLGLLASSVFMAILTWRAYLQWERAWSRESVIMGVIDWPVDWSWIWIPIGCGLLAIRLLLDATAPRLREIGAAH